MKDITYGSPNIVYQPYFDDVIRDIIQSGWVSRGKYVESLQDEFRLKYGVKHALACASATSGLIISVKAAGWHNETVKMPAFTWPSTCYAAECNGNEIKYLDIDPDTWLASASGTFQAEPTILVDTFGSQAGKVSYDPGIIYDAAHGFDLPNLGHRGIAEVISFSFTKNVTAMEGGMILTNDDKFATKAKELIRLSARMEEINAFIAMESMLTYDTIERQAHQKHIDTYLEVLPDNIQRQSIPVATNNSVFAVKFEDTSTRDKVYEILKDHNIETKIYYRPIVKGLKHTDDLYSKILALPIHSKLKDVPYICDLINSVTV